MAICFAPPQPSRKSLQVLRVTSMSSTTPPCLVQPLALSAPSSHPGAASAGANTAALRSNSGPSPSSFSPLHFCHVFLLFLLCFIQPFLPGELYSHPGTDAPTSTSGLSPLSSHHCHVCPCHCPSCCFSCTLYTSSSSMSHKQGFRGRREERRQPTQLCLTNLPPHTSLLMMLQFAAVDRFPLLAAARMCIW